MCSLENLFSLHYNEIISTWPLTRLFCALMNGYSALMYNIAPGKYIVIKVEYGLQLHKQKNH